MNWTRFFLWLSVVAWGIALGAKIFDLVVLARAWGAAPPVSLELFPYGKRWPMDPGDFFQPLSALLLVAILGALLCGWKTQPHYRLWLWVPVLSFALIWIATPTLFWPIIVELYHVAQGKVVRNDSEVATLIRHWFLYDWLRVALIGIGFLSSIKAISIPYAARTR